jgi:hypothetical protein
MHGAAIKIRYRPHKSGLQYDGPYSELEEPRDVVLVQLETRVKNIVEMLTEENFFKPEDQILSIEFIGEAIL